MTQEEQRIAIVEACPQTIRLHKTFWQYRNGRNWMECANNDPLHDLNAMHEAEKLLSFDQWVRYVRMLGKATQEEKGRCHAAAEQRAEAFLKTTNLWKP